MLSAGAQNTIRMTQPLPLVSGLRCVFCRLVVAHEPLFSVEFRLHAITRELTEREMINAGIISVTY